MKQIITPIDTTIKQTSTAVQQLYAKFQNLKQRISNTDSKRSTKSIERKSFLAHRQRDRDFKYRRIANIQPLPLSLYFQGKVDKVKEDLQSCFSKDIQSEKKIFTQEMIKMTNKIEETYMKRTDILIKKLISTQAKLISLKSIMKQKKLEQHQIKINSSFTQNPNNTTRCHTFKSLSQNAIQNNFLSNPIKYSVEQVQQRHKKQIQSLIQSYENKISLLLQGQSQNSCQQKSLSNCKYLVGEQKNCNKQKCFDLIASKDKQIKELTTQNKKLKRMLQQAKMNFQRNGELNKLLKQQNKILETAIEKLQGWKKQAEAERKNQEAEIQKMKVQLKSKSIELKKQKQDIQRLTQQSLINRQNMHSKLQKQLQQKNISFNNSPKVHYTNKKSSQIESINTDRSEILDDFKQQQIQTQIKELQLETVDIHVIRHSRSLVFNRHAQQSISFKRRQSGLLAEIHLLQQQCRLLKFKKDKFQSELKKAQNDQDMMQQQLGRLNQQIRRLNAMCQILDECGIKLIKGESLVQERLALLENDSKLKEQFYRQKEKKKRGFSLRR